MSACDIALVFVYTPIMYTLEDNLSGFMWQLLKLVLLSSICTRILCVLMTALSFKPFHETGSVQ